MRYQDSNKKKVYNYLLIACVIVFLSLHIMLINMSFKLETIIIISNIDLILLLFISYKFLLKGFLVSLFINLFEGINLYINFQMNDNIVFFQLVVFRVMAMFLSAIIYLISARQNDYKKMLETNSYLDLVTNSFNHRYFQERFETEFLKAKRMSTMLGLIMIDIYNFRKFNDIYGHKTGDKVLLETANVIKSSVRTQDIVCRYGGDEFIVILMNLKNEEINQIANNIKQNFDEYFVNFDGVKELSMSLSLGYSVYPTIAISKDELISQADAALYYAKQSGKNMIKIYKDVFTDMKMYMNSTESQLLTSLRVLLGTLSAKDRYTLGHSERVMEYAVTIGDYLGLEENKMKALKIAALLHDIGKVEIPQQILNKKEKLTNDEFELIKKHPMYSVEIISALDIKGELNPIIMSHHERMDGKGYPNGISGDMIPLESRILSVADSFDAMISERPYRKALSVDEASNELTKYAGTQFDEKVVNVFVKLLHK